MSRITVAGSLDIGVNIPKRDFLDAPPVLIETEFPIPEVEPFKRELIMPGLDSPIPVAFLLEQSRYIHQAVGAPGSIQFEIV